MGRGVFSFDVGGDDNLLGTAANVDALRALWLDRKLVSGYYLGPGDAHDFDNGAWHSACHMVAAGGVMRDPKGRMIWLEISHDPNRDEYFSSVTVQQEKSAASNRLASAEGRQLVDGATLLGYVEGTSVGRISARGVSDSPTRFLGWRRQDFDQPPGSGADGGKVWEHWCTVRDIRLSDALAASVLTAYVSLVAALGDRFSAAVARGRMEYAHPEQLAGMVRGGFISRASALWDTSPSPIPAAAEPLFLEADPAKALHAAAQLDWTNPPRYYMFARKIGSWNPASSVLRSLGNE